jgi:hypothetical protein
VHDGEVLHSANIGEAQQPATLLLAELLASPMDQFCSAKVDAVDWQVRGAVFIVIAFDTGSIHGTHNLQASFGIGAVSDIVCEKSVVRALLLFGIFQEQPPMPPGSHVHRP